MRYIIEVAMYCNEDCGLHHSLEWQKLAPSGNGPKTLNAANTNSIWTGSLASAQVWQILEFKGKRFPYWIWKLILVLCGPWMINDSWNTVVLRKPHLFATDSFGMTPEYNNSPRVALFYYLTNYTCLNIILSRVVIQKIPEWS